LLTLFMRQEASLRSQRWSERLQRQKEVAIRDTNAMLFVLSIKSSLKPFSQLRHDQNSCIVSLVRLNQGMEFAVRLF